MKIHVLDSFRIKGREGQVVTLFWPGGAEPKVGDIYKRSRDGAEWTVTGIETRSWPLKTGHPVGLLLRGSTDVASDDELERI